MPSIKEWLFVCILMQNLIRPATSATEGTVSVDYGRISNMPDDRIHVAAALTLADCVQQCVDFSKNFDRYVFEDCYAYNYDFDQYTCELIHSIEPMNYTVARKTRWQTGRKY